METLQHAPSQIVLASSIETVVEVGASIIGPMVHVGHHCGGQELTDQDEGLPEVDVVSVGLAAGDDVVFFGVVHLGGEVVEGQPLYAKFHILQLVCLSLCDFHEEFAIGLACKEVLVDTVFALQMEAPSNVGHGGAKYRGRLET